MTHNSDRQSARFHFLGEPCDIIDGVVRSEDKVVVIGRIDRDGAGTGYKTTSIEINEEIAEKLAEDNPAGGSPVHQYDI